jgi:uncharacterized protein YjiS (DUF1127 family)
MDFVQDATADETAGAGRLRLAPARRHRAPRAFTRQMAAWPVRALVAGLRRRAGWRRDAATLGALDDRALGDLGLVRGDLARSGMGFTWACTGR